MRRRMAILALAATMAVTGVAAGGCQTPATTWTNASVDPFAEYLTLRDLNLKRFFAGRHGLWSHGSLNNKAREWSNWMSVGGCGGGQRICHSNLTQGINGVVPGWTLIGENVGVGGNLGALFAAFAASPGHRANILDPRWNYVGVGVVARGGLYYVTVVFLRA